MIKRRLLTGMAAIALGLWANNAVAQVQLNQLNCASIPTTQEEVGAAGFIGFTHVLGTQKNGSALPANRTNALASVFNVEELTDPKLTDGDSTTNKFISLGYGGSFTYHFGTAGVQINDVDGADIRIFETSWATDGCSIDGIEKALVYLSNDNGGTWSAPFELCRDENNAIDFASVGMSFVTDIKIVNHPDNTTPDGFDLDGIVIYGECAVPQTDPDCYGFEIVESFQGPRYNGSPITDINRIDPSKMLGMPENSRTNGSYNFFSLGQNGYAVLGMASESDLTKKTIITDGTSEPDLRVYETTFSDPSCMSYPEYVLVQVSHLAAGPWISVGEYCQSSNISIDLDAYLPSGYKVSYVRLSTDDRVSPDDYFDVDGVEAIWGCENYEVPPTACTTLACEEGTSYVEGTTKSGGTIMSTRSIWSKALGFPEDSDTFVAEANANFVSLGYGGSMTLCLDGIVNDIEGPDFEIVETTYGGSATCSADNTAVERAFVYATMDGSTWYQIGHGCQDFEVDIANAIDGEGNPVVLPYVTQIRVVNDDTNTTPDGYDLDGVRIINGSCEGDAMVIDDSAATANNFAALTKTSINAYPNPTTGVVNFRFASAVEGKVTLAVYNMNGQLVAQLADEVVNANDVKVSNYDLSSLPNGIYLAKLTTPEGVTTAKVMLNK